MATHEGDGTLFVPFAPGPLRIQRNGALTVLWMGVLAWVGGWIAFRAVASLDPVRGVNPGAHVRMLLLEVVFVAAGPFFVAVSLYGLALYLDRRGDRKPALAIGPEGVLWGIGLGRPIFLPWAELASMDFEGGPPDDDTPRKLGFLPRDVDATRARVGSVRWYLATSSGTLAVPYSTLATSWPEVSAALDRFAKLNPPPPPFVRPKTLEEFQTRFREAPLGVWTTIVGMSSPGDTTVWFCVDRTGGIKSGAAGFLGGAEGFEWRPQGDWAIEVRLEREESWTAYEYGFSESEGEIKIFFDVDMSAEDWIQGLGYESFSYAGPCRDDR